MLSLAIPDTLITLALTLTFSSVTSPERLLIFVEPDASVFPVNDTVDPVETWAISTTPEPSLSIVTECPDPSVARSTVCGPLPVELMVLRSLMPLTVIAPVPLLIA